MPNNPVQVVLNTAAYLVVPENSGGGPPKDFYAGRNRQFVTHRDELAKQVSSVGRSMRTSGVDTGFVKVTLSEEAWAKSHRPTRALFPPSSLPCVGASGLGELFFMVTPSGLDEVDGQIRLAELEPRTKRNKTSGKVEEVPSYRRSEVGAIESISVPGSDEKRSFDLKSAIEWLSDPRTSGAYLVELFDLSQAARYADPNIRARRTRATNQFLNGLSATELSIDVYPFHRNEVGMDDGGIPRTLAIRLVAGPRGVRRFESKATQELTPFDAELSHHRALLRFLDNAPLVERITLPPLVLQSGSTAIEMGEMAELPKRRAKAEYPKVGLIDGGVSGIFSDWLIGRSELLADEHIDTNHGSFIAGLLIAGQKLNGSTVAPEQDGCQIYDACVYPDRNSADAFKSYYPMGAKGFLEEIGNAVASAKEQFGVRVFNISINMVAPVEEDRYSPFAERLDQIADENDVILVVSAGNLKSADQRSPWPASHDEAIRYLATRSSRDPIFQPSESSRSLTVGAVSTPNTPPHIGGTPACYSRRGPGLKVGVKPDLAHYGGCPPVASAPNCGLFSVDHLGALVSNIGTSYAAPLVAKSIATLESRIKGYMTREALIALTVHHAQVPEPLRHKKIAEIARQFVGFGIPAATDDVLVTDDHQITLVFSDSLLVNQELHFDFPWPKCLVKHETGGCRGNVRMTLVYQPPLNAAFGAEFVRVNLDAHLRQEDEEGSFRGQLKQVSIPKSQPGNKRESELIKHGLKWWPVKIYERNIPSGIGVSSSWQLAIDSVARAGEEYPAEGVPFTVVLSISDPESEGNVFNDVRQTLQARGVTMSDIRVAGRVRPRA